MLSNVHQPMPASLIMPQPTQKTSVTSASARNPVIASIQHSFDATEAKKDARSGLNTVSWSNLSSLQIFKILILLGFPWWTGDRRSRSRSPSRSRSRSRSHRHGHRRCNTDLKVAVVATDRGKENKCTRKLRSNNSITRFLDRNLNTRKMRDYGVVRVHDCSSTRKMKNRMEDLESRRYSSHSDAKVLAFVIEDDNLSNACERALRKVSRDIKRELSCRDIRRMRDRRTASNARDIIVVKVKSESQCTRRRLKKKVLRATDMD